jgi:hypothetical protein
VVFPVNKNETLQSEIVGPLFKGYCHIADKCIGI